MWQRCAMLWQAGCLPQRACLPSKGSCLPCNSALLTLLPAHRTCNIVQIHFERIPDESVDQLIAEGEVFFCAGGLMVEHGLVQPHVTRMVGSLDSVMGLAKDLLLRLLCAAAAQGPAR